MKIKLAYYESTTYMYCKSKYYRKVCLYSLSEDKVGRILRVYFQVSGRKRIRPQQFFYNQYRLKGKFYHFCIKSQEIDYIINKMAKPIELDEITFNKAIGVKKEKEEK